MAATMGVERWEGTDVSVGEIERHLADLRSAVDEGGMIRTSVLTHLAWVPPEWEERALETLAGMAERHPSRTIVLVPQPDAGGNGIDATLWLNAFPLPDSGRRVCSEVIELRLRGSLCRSPASIAAPLLIADLPVFLRWRGQPPFGQQQFEELVDLVQRLIVDSTEWPRLPAPYAQLSAIFHRAAVSDIAWARTTRWRRQLASMWPEIAGVRKIRVTGTAAQAHLLAGWLRSRFEKPIGLEHEDSERLIGVELDGEAAPFPPGDPPQPSDVLSEELDRFGRDPVYEAAVGATV
ncbi:MAG: glucose-6-phosphate dehydrogenase assembly protein OpcA [Thermoleophilia bacterium]|nr:glucose-6-phosphate dehydrogenase assembly protein OpcA [Thermoleophilia bacterium]